MPDMAYKEVYKMNKVETRRLLVQTYHETGSISETARRWHTSRQVVRKWVRRYQQEGEAGLRSRPRRPHTMPRRTDAALEAKVLALRREYGYGRKRLSHLLQQDGIPLSEHTIRHILRRGIPPEAQQRKRRRQTLYPARWVWEQEEPFRLFQVDTKTIPDKGTLGTQRVTHLYRARLPRYQWTALEGRSRLRFLAYSHHLHRSNGIAFLILVLMWLRGFGVEEEVTFQTDWGQEFGGDNPEQVQQLSARFLEPLAGRLCRYPKGRKGYNGRVERSHRSDDEEFYAPCLLHIPDETTFLRWSLRWEYVYNVLRPHQGKGMNGQPPLTVLKKLGYDGDEQIALFPTILLDRISADLLLALDQPPGNDLLTHYTQMGGMAL